MEKWQKFLDKTDITEDELSQIPGMSNNNTNGVHKYFSNHFGVSLDELFDNISISAVDRLNSNIWLSAKDANKLNFNSFYFSKCFVSHHDSYVASSSPEVFERNLYIFYYSLLPLKIIFKYLGKENKKWNNQWSMETLQSFSNYSLIKSVPYPYFDTTRIGSECKWVLGVLESAITIHSIKVYQSKELLCSTKLKNLLEGVYAKYNWVLSEENDSIFLNNQRIGKRKGIKWAYKNKKVNIEVVPINEGLFNAILIIDDYYYEEKMVFSSGEIYEAPYCLYELSWRPMSFLKRMYYGLMSFLAFKTTGLLEIDKQINFTNKQHFEVLNQKNRLIENLTQLNKQKEEFLTNTSHDFKTPLNVILGISENLLVNEEINITKNNEQIELIADHARRLSFLVDDIQDYSKLKDGEINLIKKKISLEPLIVLCLKSFRHTLNGKKIKLQFVNYLSTNIFGDENRILQILNNLLSNAIKYTEEGNITISLEKHNDDYLSIAIQDTGIGIPHDRLNLIFKAYERIENEEHNASGSGIGLFITNKLITLHGGKIWVESVVGEGSVFTFTMPIYKYDESPVIHLKRNKEVILIPEEESEWQWRSDSIDKIMIVDDEAANIKVLEGVFRKSDFGIYAFLSARAALDKIDQGFNPKLILLDIMMPGITGYEFCEIIRNKYSAIELPIIMLSAKGLTGDIVDSLAAGANDFIKKPFSRAELLSRVETQIKLRDLYLEKEASKRNISRIDNIISLGLSIFQTQNYYNDDIIDRLTKRFLQNYEFHLDNGSEISVSEILSEYRSNISKGNETIKDIHDVLFGKNTISREIDIHTEDEEEIVDRISYVLTSLLDTSKKRTKVEIRNLLPEFQVRYKISKREGEVLEQIILGKTNKDIGEYLYISISSVKSHVSELLRKTESKNRAQLILQILFN